MSKDLAYEQMMANNTGKIHISFSEFSLFNQCGHKHLIEKHLKIEEQPPSIHLFFGNAVHEAIELSLKENWGIKKRVAYFRETFEREMRNNMIGTPEFDEMYSFLEQGENILKILSLTKILEEYELVSVEEPLYEKVYGKFYFKGFIDLVLKNRRTGRILIVDWKTSGQRWFLKWKLNDYIFLCQMRFYKFFWARKNNVPLENIDCRYIVLNRLKDKKKPELGFGDIQEVDINSTNEEIKGSLDLLARTIKSIHIQQEFPKAKIHKEAKEAKKSCMFCKYKDDSHHLCDKTDTQYRFLLKEYKK
jgi:hypothetical protein